jgi:hypothetical protein
LAALQSFVESIKGLDRFENLTLLLDSNNTWAVRNYGGNNGHCRTNEKIWDEMTSLPLHKSNLKFELVRLAPRERVFRYYNMADTEFRRVYGCEAEDALAIRSFKELMSNCTVKAAYLPVGDGDNGSWQIIENLPEEVLLLLAEG